MIENNNLLKKIVEVLIAVEQFNFDNKENEQYIVFRYDSDCITLYIRDGLFYKNIIVSGLYFEDLDDLIKQIKELK